MSSPSSPTVSLYRPTSRAFWYASISLGSGKRFGRSTGVRIPESQSPAAQEEARERALEAAREIARGLAGEQEGPEDLALSELLERYLDYRHRYLNAKHNLSDPRIRAAFRTLTELVGGDVRVSSITRARAQDCLYRMGGMPDGSGLGLSPSSITQYLRILRSAWEVAIEQEWATKPNPWEKTRAPRSKPGSQPTRDAFSPEEIARLLEVAPGEWRLPILLASQAGLRLRDAADLRWTSVDFTSRRFPNGALVFTASKTSREVVVPLSEPLRVELAKTPREEREGPVCRIYGRPSSTLSRAFGRIVARAGIEPKRSNREIRKLSFHSLRHSFVTRLKETGADSSVSMMLAGHSSAGIHRIYDHTTASPDLLVSAIEKAGSATRLKG